MKRLGGYIIFVLLLFVQNTTRAEEQERLEFIFRYGFIRGGKATLTSTDTLFNNKSAVHLKVHGRSVGMLDVLYKVDDIYESWVNPENSRPLKSIRNVREGNYRYYNETLFYYDKDSALSQRSGWLSVPNDISDMLSVVHYIRNGLKEKLKEGQPFLLPLWHHDKITNMKIKYVGKKSLRTRFGKINCMVFSPQLEKGRLFQKTNAIKIWISDDVNMVPLLLDIDIKIGALKCELVEYWQNGGVHLK